MVLNITFAALSITNLCSSPLFFTGKSKATFSFFNIHNSFSTAVLAEQSLSIIKSKFINFLSPAIKISSLSKSILESNTVTSSQTTSNFDSTIFQRCLATNENNGGGINCQNSPIQVINCFFAFCEASNKGGAIYANLNNTNDASIRNTVIYYCTASEGSSFYINNANLATFEQISFEESAPSRRSGIKFNCLISTQINLITKANFTSCYSLLSSAALQIDCSNSQSVSFLTFQECSGYNILCLKGVGDSKSSSIEKVALMNNKLNGEENSIGNDRLEGNSLICIMGEWRISDSYFIMNETANLASGGFGIVTFFRCHFDLDLASIEPNRCIIFTECHFNQNMDVPLNYFTANTISYEGPHFFNGETARPNNKPPKPKFVLSKKIGYIIGAIIFTIVFVVITVLACNLLRRHRQHVLCKLHQVYAYEARSSGSESLNNNEEDDDLMIVVNEEDKKKEEKMKMQVLNDFDDYYNKIKKDNRFKFDDIPVPDTNLWDTDEGEVEVPDDDAFVADVNDILGGNSVAVKSGKGKKKKKKKNSSPLIKKGKKK